MKLATYTVKTNTRSVKGDVCAELNDFEVYETVESYIRKTVSQKIAQLKEQGEEIVSISIDKQM